MDEVSERAADLAARREREQRRLHAQRPKKIRDVVAQLIAARGYGRTEGNRQLQAAWEAAAGETLAKGSRASRISRGRLEVLVANSTIMQELTFEKRRILGTLQEQLPDARIRDLRLRVAAIE